MSTPIVTSMRFSGWKGVAVLLCVVVLLALCAHSLREGMETCPTYVEGGLLSPADIAAMRAPQEMLEEDRAAGISINLKVKRALPSGAALNSEGAVTRLF